jgi:uncharacterized protein
MLTADLAMSWRRGDRISPRYLKVEDANYLRTAEELIAILREHGRRRRAELDEALNDFIGIGTDYQILRGLIKLLTDRCKFETTAPLDPEELRRRLFLAARGRHPIDAERRRQVLASVAEELSIESGELEESLFGDLGGNQRLVEFDEPSASDLLDEYNLAQAQALLYRCVEMTIRVEPQPPAGYRRLFNAVKHYRLIHTIRGQAENGYEARLSGPVSLFHRSQKYGVRMSVFLPALLACDRWQMRAEIEGKNGSRAFFELDSDQRQLRAPEPLYAPEENAVIEKLLGKWPDIESEWGLERSFDVIDLGQAAFAPDLIARSMDGRKVYLEFFGFWTPRYLEDRLKDFAFNQTKNFILLISEELRGSREGPATLPPNVLSYKSSLNPLTLLAAIEALTEN